MQGHFSFEPTHQVLICKLHGQGIHPTQEAIKRHLRGEGHRVRGEVFRQTVANLTRLPLKSLKQLQNISIGVDAQPVSPIPYLKILQGWNCISCTGRFLTTSLELVRRHAASIHGRRRGQDPLWESCQLQTFFGETKYKRYFRVDTNGDDEDVVELESSTKSNTAWSDLPQTITLWHALTPFAAKHVRLSASRLDILLKSEAFRVAITPLFDPNHIDAALNISSVFPQSLNDPIFLNALFYSTVQIANQGTPNIESLSLQSRTLGLLNEKLQSTTEELSPSNIGAIMILKSAAYKTSDLEAHEAHTRGLREVFKVCCRNGSILTPAAKRGTFWLDLFAAVFVGSARQMSHLDQPLKFIWARERGIDLEHLLPIGFWRCKHDLPVALLECVADAVELLSYIRARIAPHTPNPAQLDELDMLQGSIESRLVDLRDSRRPFGALAEIVRLALFLFCYSSFTETWNDSLIPHKVASELLELIELRLSNVTEMESGEHVDLLLWLLFVSASVVRSNQAHMEDLRCRQSLLMLRVRRSLTKVDLKPVLQAAMTDFVYTQDWLSQRYDNETWMELETSINAT